MLKTIRHRILTEIAEALKSLVIVAAPGGGGGGGANVVLMVDVAAVAQGSRAGEWVQVIQDATRAGKVVFELDAGPSETTEQGNQAGPGAGVTRWRMPVVLAAHLPENMPPGEDGLPITPERMADLVGAAIQALAGTLFPGQYDGATLTQCGRWYNLVTKDVAEQDNLPLALWTMVRSVSGVMLSPALATRMTVAVLEVEYRTHTGRPEVLA